MWIFVNTTLAICNLKFRGRKINNKNFKFELIGHPLFSLIKLMDNEYFSLCLIQPIEASLEQQSLSNLLKHHKNCKLPHHLFRKPHLCKISFIAYQERKLKPRRGAINISLALRRTSTQFKTNLNIVYHDGTSHI